MNQSIFSLKLQNWNQAVNFTLFRLTRLWSLLSSMGYLNQRFGILHHSEFYNGIDGIYSEKQTCWYLSGSSMYPIMIPRLLITASLTKSALSSINICCNIERTKELRISFWNEQEHILLFFYTSSRKEQKKMTDTQIFTIQVKYILTRCYVCFKSSFLKHRRHYRCSWSTWLSSTLPFPLILLSKDNIYPELGIDHLPAYFCIFTMYVPIPETFTMHFWQINSHHSAINRLFCVKWLFYHYLWNSEKHW